jgi:hypothetical protein
MLFFLHGTLIRSLQSWGYRFIRCPILCCNSSNLKLLLSSISISCFTKALTTSSRPKNMHLTNLLVLKIMLLLNHHNNSLMGPFSLHARTTALPPRAYAALAPPPCSRCPSQPPCRAHVVATYTAGTGVNGMDNIHPYSSSDLIV